jgi:hypothetical protein
MEKIVFSISFFGSVSLIAGLLFRHLRLRMEVLKVHAEARLKLLGLVGSVEQLLAFAATEEGRRLLEPPTLPSQVPHGLRMVQAGVGLGVLALGFLVATGFRTPARAVVIASAGLALVVGALVGRRLHTQWTLKDGDA